MVADLEIAATSIFRTRVINAVVVNMVSSVFSDQIINVYINPSKNF